MDSRIIHERDQNLLKIGLEGHKSGEYTRSTVDVPCGRSSAVERHVANVNVVSSNLIARCLYWCGQCDCPV